jgi:hypothetical protein
MQRVIRNLETSTKIVKVKDGLHDIRFELYVTDYNYMP